MGVPGMGGEISSPLASMGSSPAVGGNTGLVHMLVAAVALGLLGALLLWKQRSTSAHLRRIHRLPGGTMGLPLLGETLQFHFTHEAFMTSHRQRYGDVFKSHLFGSPTVISVDEDVNRFVLQNEGRLFQASYPKAMIDILGEHNILEMDGQLHKKMRGIPVGFLSGVMLRDRVMNDVEDCVAANLRTWKDRAVNVQEETRAMTFYLIVKQIFGFSPGGETDVMRRDYSEFIKALVAVPIALPGTAFSNGLKARAKLVRTLTKVIEERRQQPLQSHTDVLSTILQSEKDNKDNIVHTSEFIIDFLVGLLVAGHETTPVAMAMSVKYITEHPEVLALLREEHKKIRDAKKPCERLTWEDYKKMSFTQNVIDETLRLANIVAGVYRKALQDIEIKDHFVPKGWKMLVYHRASHLDGTYYKDPLKFNPLRWQDKNESGNHFFPFGGGIRLCVGNELARLHISFFLHFLLTQYRWEPVGKEKISYYPVVKMAKGYPILVKSL